MLEKIDTLLKELEVFKAKTTEEVEQFRIKQLGKKGTISQLFDEFKALPSEKKREIGKPLNELKNKTLKKINDLKEKLNNNIQKVNNVDLTMPAAPYLLGSRHPISIMRNKILDIFIRMGFVISEGPEIDDNWHVFSALNFPEEHPARDMQDTFFIKRNPDIILRTHTSSVQIHEMEETQPPIRTVTPGRVFRNEAISARAHCIFHQVEALFIDKGVSFADLRQTLDFFAKELFGSTIKTRLRPSYFPFTEPSAEMDISCSLCGGKGCNVCKYTGWLEILGCGMVDVSVLENTNIDSKKYSGFALGMGIERIAMLKYGIKDLRLFFENDIRFLNQFQSCL